MACVGSANELTQALAALSTAPSNNDTDEIRIQAGVYSAPATGWQVDLAANHDLAIHGGYLDDLCTQQSLDASLTVLDGGNVAPVLTLDTPPSSMGGPNLSAIEVSGLTFQNGHVDAAFAETAAGLKVSDTGPISNGAVLVERNIFRHNVASGPNDVTVGGLLAATDGPSLVVRNNLFVDNASSAVAAAYVFSNDGAKFSNNTFSANTSSGTAQSVRQTMDFFAFGGLELANNVFWGNAVGANGFDIDFRGQTHAAHAHDNDIETSAGTPSVVSGALHVDPHFAGVDDFRPSSTSPLIGAGLNTPVGGLAAVDLDGAPRIDGAAVDIGAYESSFIFVAGFD